MILATVDENHPNSGHQASSIASIRFLKTKISFLTGDTFYPGRFILVKDWGRF